MNNHHFRSRRRFLQLMALGAGGFVSPGFARDERLALLTRPVPSSGERLPLIGLGSSRTFNVGSDPQALDNVAEVMRYFFNAGGSVIDSSPMYGSAQPAIGYGLAKLKRTQNVFSADKVWTWNANEGHEQIERSRQHWKVKTFDLMQVHNLVEWPSHLATLQQMKKSGEIKYVGITTSHGRRHDEFVDIMKTQPLDFVQFTYNILDREAEQVLLPLARKKGIAVIINRPFQRGDLIDALETKPLPAWAGDIDCYSWPQFLLKFIVSHPDVTCAIPATSQVPHIKENMAAGYGALANKAMRKRMIDYVEKVI